MGIIVGRISLFRRWGFLKIDHSVGQYYRSLFKLEFGLRLQRPSNDEHITVISPHDEVDLTEHSGYNNLEMKVLRSSGLYWNGNAVWFEVESSDIDKFRKRLGLDKQFIAPHFCIGYFENGAI